MIPSHDSPARPPARRDHSIAQALGVAALLVAALSVIIGAVLLSSYRDTIAREQTNLRNLATAFAAQTHYATRALELIMNGTQRTYLRARADMAPGDDPDYLSHETGSAEHLLGVHLFDNQGLVARRVFGPAPAPASARPPQLDPDTPLYVAVSDVDPVSGRAVINVGRTLLDADGKPAGSILTQSDSSYYQRIFASADLGSGGSVTLLHRDGTMLLRGPTLPRAIGRSFRQTPLFQRYLPAAPQGAFEATSPIDGETRLYGYSTVDGYPLVIITGRNKADALQLWDRWFWTAAAFWAILSLTLFALAWRVGSGSARKAALIGRLATSEARLAHSSRYLKAILDSLATPLWVLDRQRRILMANGAFGQFVGAPVNQLAGRPEHEALDGAATARDALYGEVADGAGTRIMETELRDGQGRSRTVIQQAARLESEDNTVQIVNTLTDITERKQVEMRLAYLAEFDLLTELPNQDQFRRVLLEAIHDAAPGADKVALLVVALDRQQEVADLLGQEADDEVAQQAAARLRTLQPGCRCIARIRNNEFALIFEARADGPDVDQFAAGVHRLLSDAFSVRSREFYLGPLVGIALYPQDATSVHELLRLADIAKHRAGAEGSEPVHFYSERSHSILNERLTIEEQLRRALERRELRLVYQPKIDIASGRIAGFEALLRWNSPVLGDVGPANFVPIAESTGLIVPIGAWVLEAACAQAGAWQRELGTQVKVAVNLSVRQLHQKDLIPMVRHCIDAGGIPPSALELEITESTAMGRADAVDALLNDIRELGVELSIDDFGTGYSSLAYLKRFPVQRLKVDRAFVHDLGRDADSVAIIRSIVTLGHGLQMRIVAEGVETAAQLELLRELGCDEYQGYLFSRPVEADEVPGLLRANFGGAARA